jgi:radical SAM superfamily enzyme YgiQ (UPF0313 family)
MKIVLIMPQSEMYRRGGIFGKSLRYAPLTLTTLAALVPEELEAEIRIVDQGVEPLELDAIDADLVGITCITANAPAVYSLSAELRARGVTTVIGGVHPTLVPDDAQPHADAIVVGYAEESWPQLLRDFARDRMRSLPTGRSSRTTFSPALACARPSDVCSLWETTMRAPGCVPTERT